MKRILMLPLVWVAFFPHLLQSQDSWQETGLTNNSPIRPIAFDSSGGVLVGTSDKGIYRSTNDGIDWLRINNRLEDSVVASIAVHPSGVIFAAGHGLYRSTDNGDHWAMSASGILSTVVTNVFINTNGQVFAGTGDGLYLSTNTGDSWELIDSSIISPLSMMKNRITNTIFGTTTHLIRSTDDGAHWENTSLSGEYLKDVAINSNGYVFVANLSLARSTDNGDSWDNIVVPSASAVIINSKNHIFTGGPPSGVFKSTDGGQSWTGVNQGLSDSEYVAALRIDRKGHLYAGTTHGRLFRTAQSTTSVSDAVGEQPKEFSLEQNYPNPFNPRTVILFTVPKASHVTLRIFTVLGEEIATLVSERLPAGSYTRQWNPTNVPSGFYFYRLQTGSFTETKKLLLLR